MYLVNIYCDESCHLEVTELNKNNQKSMALGGIICNENAKRDILEDIRRIKVKHGLSRHGEFKWTKVSDNKLEFYKEIIRYFFNNNKLMFRVLVFKRKTEFYYDYYDHDDLYYMAYYLLLKNLINPSDNNSIYIDKKDTRGGRKVAWLKNKLATDSNTEFRLNIIEKIQIIDSRDSELMQLADLLTGAVAYINRIEVGENLVSRSKLEIIELIKELSGYSLTKTTLISERKFNIFIWTPNHKERGV
ncbi:hypothetical protein SV13_07315 [Clostridium perfringens]|nr:hypothetical protein SV13_07315 [Clostridium perfringens]